MSAEDKNGKVVKAGDHVRLEFKVTGVSGETATLEPVERPDSGQKYSMSPVHTKHLEVLADD
jgi:hypothetical protein